MGGFFTPFGGDFDISGGGYMPLTAIGNDSWGDQWKQPTTLSTKIPALNINVGGGGSGTTAQQTARNTVVNIVNQAEPYFRNNRDSYLANQASRDRQIEALKNFDNAWNALVDQLSRYGAEGQAAIRDRAPGGGHSWFGYYRDPIEKDPRLGPVSGTQPGVNLNPGGYVVSDNMPFDTSQFGGLFPILIIGLAVIVIIRVVK